MLLRGALIINSRAALDSTSGPAYAPLSFCLCLSTSPPDVGPSGPQQQAPKRTAHLCLWLASAVPVVNLQQFLLFPLCDRPSDTAPVTLALHKVALASSDKSLNRLYINQNQIKSTNLHGAQLHPSGGNGVTERTNWSTSMNKEIMRGGPRTTEGTRTRKKVTKKAGSGV